LHEKLRGAAPSASAAPLRLRPREKRLICGAALLLAGVASFALVASDLGVEHHGVPADEAFYHTAARRHIAWLSALGAPGSFSPQTLDAHFAWQSQVVVHPSFSRLLSGASWRLFHGAFGQDAITAYRLHNALAYALVALGIAWFCWRSWGPACGVGSVLIFWSNARFFGHAHTAMTDVVLSCLWLWAPLLLLRGVTEERRGSVLAAAFLSGLALATKLTGLALVGLLAVWPLLARGCRAWRSSLLLLCLPPTVFFALNPQTWHEPLGWWLDFLGDFRDRESARYIPTLFLGQRYAHRVPWYAPSVHALVTTPPVILLLSLLGGARGGQRLARADAAQRLQWLHGPWPLLLAAGLCPLVLVSLPSLPAHDLERLFLPLQPFLVIYAGCGLCALLRSGPLERLGQRSARFGASTPRLLLAALLFLPPLVEAARQHPYPLTYFNALIGGMRGAENRGLDVAYLKLEANQSLLDALDRQLPPGASLYANFLYVDLVHHQRAGRLRPDVRVVRDPSADFAILYNRRGWMTFFEARLWDAGPPALWRLTHRGVDLLRLYSLRRGGPPRANAAQRLPEAAAKRSGSRAIGVYNTAGAPIWHAFHESGVHATRAGVLHEVESAAPPGA
jgi:4-amino-4-deoxy-L-arabinose transferase-like glycosyltransferase